MRGLELRLTKEASLGSFPPSLGRFERFQVYSLVRSRHGYLISRVNDGASLFLETMLAKMHPPEKRKSRIAIIFNGSPLSTAHREDRIYLDGAYRGLVNKEIQTAYSDRARYEELSDHKYISAGGIFDIMAFTVINEHLHQV